MADVVKERPGRDRSPNKNWAALRKVKAAGGLAVALREPGGAVSAPGNATDTSMLTPLLTAPPLLTPLFLCSHLCSHLCAHRLFTPQARRATARRGGRVWWRCPPCSAHLTDRRPTRSSSRCERSQHATPSHTRNVWSPGPHPSSWPRIHTPVHSWRRQRWTGPTGRRLRAWTRALRKRSRRALAAACRSMPPSQVQCATTTAQTRWQRR